MLTTLQYYFFLKANEWKPLKNYLCDQCQEKLDTY